MEARPTYAIRRWRRHSENSASLQVKKATWVPMPNKHDGATYRRVIAHSSCGQVLCGWTYILQVASKMPTRGVLHDGDEALRPIDLHFKTGIPAKIFELAFEVLVAPEIGWLEIIEWPNEFGPGTWETLEQSRGAQTYLDASSPICVEQKGTEGKDTNPPNPPEGGTRRRAPRKGGGSKEAFRNKTESEAIEKELRAIENRTSETATGKLYSKEDRKAKKELSQRLGELRKELIQT